MPSQFVRIACLKRLREYLRCDDCRDFRSNRAQANTQRQLRCEFGAGEGIRTLDPNLGKVVLYP